MGAIFDAAEKRDEKAQAAAMPPREGEPLHDTMGRLYDWQGLPKAERQRQSGAYQELQSQRQEAKALGITPEHGELIRQNELLRQQIEQGTKASTLPHELTPAIDAVRQIYPEQKFHDVAQRYVEIDRLVKADPVRGVAWIAEQSGLNPLQLAQQLAVRFGNEQMVMHNATRLVDEFFASNPDAAKLESEMLEAIESGKVQRTGAYERINGSY